MTRASDKRKKERRQQATLKKMEVTAEEALAIVDRIKSTVSAEDHAKLKAMAETRVCDAGAAGEGDIPSLDSHVSGNS